MAEDWGLKVSVEGKDVLTCTDLETAFKNDLSLLKVAFSGTGTIPSGNVATITHNLGYVPQFLVFGETAGDKYLLSTGDFADYTISSASTTTLSIYGSVGDSYTYYIFHETVDGSTYSETTSDNDYGLKVMKTGKSITSTNLEDQSLNSEKNCLKIAKTGSYSGTSADSGYNSVTIAHGLSYIPGIMGLFMINNDGKYYFGTSGNYISLLAVDDTNITFTYHDVPTGQSIKLYYMLFVERASI